MKYSSNYSLKKPDLTDIVNVDDLNFNSDKIDSELKKINDNAANISSQLEQRANKTLSENYSMLIKNSSISNFIKLMISGVSCKVACLGDSITDAGNVNSGVTGGASDPSKGWFRLLEKYIKNTYGYQIEFTNRGVGGHNVLQSYNRLKTDIIPYNYDLIIVELGTNDWNYRTSLENFEINYRKLIDKLVKNTRASIICVGLGWFKDWKSTTNTTPEWKYNQIIQKICLEYGIGYVDTRFEMMNSGYSWEDITLTSDPVHPNDLGHEIWFNAVKQFISFNGYLIEGDFRNKKYEYFLDINYIESNKEVVESINEGYYFGKSSYVANTEPGTRIYFRFYGDAIKLIYTKSSLYGKAKIYVDGGVNATYDLDTYNSSITFGNIFEIKGLKLGWHFISIAIDTKNDLASGYGFNIETVLIKNDKKTENIAFTDNTTKKYSTIFYENPFVQATCYANGYALVNQIDTKSVKINTYPSGQGGYCTLIGY